MDSLKDKVSKIRRASDKANKTASTTEKKAYEPKNIAGGKIDHCLNI